MFYSANHMIQLAVSQRLPYVLPMVEHNQNVQDLIDDFAFLDDWEDRYTHVIELGKYLEPLTDAEKNETTKVKGCVSQVWLVKEVTTGAAPVLTYRGDSDAHIVKGLVAVVLKVFSGRSAKEISATDAAGILSQLGLAEHLSPQRSNGLNAMIARIQNDAAQLLEN